MFNMNKKMMERAIKQMGMKTEEVEASEVIIKGPSKEIIISNPKVTKVNVMGQDTFQVAGEVSERDSGKVSDEDIKLVMEKTGATKPKVKKALKESKGDIAEAILKLKK
jgi:nascent polypeptide-associated complex subunit alpha